MSMLTAQVQDLSREELVKDPVADIWGAACGWYGDQIGAEYNYCVEEYKGELINSSAIYSMHWNGDPNDPNATIETDTSDFKHYEVDFSRDDWEERLCDAMRSFILERI